MPFVNLVRPLHVVEQTFLASSEQGRGDRGGLIVRWWWAAYIISWLLGRGVAFTDDLQLAMIFDIASNLALIFAGVLFITIVSRLTSRQETTIESQIAAQVAEAPTFTPTSSFPSI